jgi:hypothetical protein
MIFKPFARKLALIAHLTFSVGWIGAVVAFLVLAVLSNTSDNEQLVRACYVAMNVVVRYAIVPVAFVSLASGLVSALGTTWGLFRHYWVIVKLVLTLIAIAVLLVQLAPIDALAAVAADASAPLSSMKEAQRPLIHAIGGLVVLLVVQILGVYKPKGLTRYGWRKENESKANVPAAPTTVR